MSVKTMIKQHQILAFLGAASLGAGLLASGSSAQAVQLAPGTLNVRTNEGLFLGNNVIDFGGVRLLNPGIAAGGGAGVVTTPLNNVNPLDPPQSGIFGTAPIPLVGGDFQNAPVTFYDLFTPVNIVTGITYSALALAGTPSVLLLDIDTTTVPNGAPDFQYFFTAFTRTTPSPNEVTINFDGFFRDLSGTYADTPSTLSIFNATGVNAASLPQYASIADYNATPPIPSSPGFLAAVDGTIVTQAQAVSEPSAMAGMVGVGMLGLGSFLKKRQGKKAE